MAKIASASGRQGLSTILQTRDAPLPFLRDSRVVEACAMIFPPLKRQLRSKRGIGARIIVSLHWFLGVCLGELTTVDLGYYLIRHDYCYSELDISWILSKRKW
jgi:hypothetical protein